MYMYQRQRQPNFRKYATAVLTPEAMQAAMQPPPMDPGMQGGAPMDPSMMGGMMPPGGAPMPPQGAPMDPSMMGGQPPMDPSMAGGMPPQGGAPMDPTGGALPPELLQDPMFIQFLAEAFGVMFDQMSGQFFDQNGQPVPPEILMQAAQAYMQAMQQIQGGGATMDPNAMGGQPPMDPSMQGGAPMDPSMMGGQPPMDPSMMGGAPMDPAAMGGQPPADMDGQGEQPMDPMMQELASLMATVMEDTIVTPMKETISSLEKQIADLKKMMTNVRNDMGTMKDDIDSSEHTQDKRDEEDRDEEEKLRADIAADLQPTIPQEPELVEVEPEIKTASAWRPVNILDLLGGN
jgi:hypothetical protein